MAKMLDMTRPPDPCTGPCSHVVARPGADFSDSAGFGREIRDVTSDAALNRRDARPFKINEAGFLMVVDRYRERVDVEIGKASERGARWWSRRLVQLYEGAGLVRLDK